MNRLSITVNDLIEEKLREIQGELIKGRKRDISFTTVANMVWLGGILASGYIKKEDWQTIKEFLDDQQINIDKEGLTDNYVNMMK